MTVPSSSMTRRPTCVLWLLACLLTGPVALAGSAQAVSPPPSSRPAPGEAKLAASAAGDPVHHANPAPAPEGAPAEAEPAAVAPASGPPEPAPATSEPPAPQADAPALEAARRQYSFGPDEVCPFCRLTPRFPEGRSGLHWHGHWRPVGTPEYIAAPTLLAAGVAFSLALPSPNRARWSGPILFDSAARDALRIGSADGRQHASDVSDAIFLLEVLHPTVIDPLITAWWIRRSPRVAWQMFVINAQAYGLTVLLNDITKRLTARARPWAVDLDCENNPEIERCRSGGGYRSFYSGHAATTATGAGLICAHHTQLALYQNPVLDVGTCLLAVAGTAVTGAMRIASDNHWASDVLVGHLTGYFSGYLLPTLLYYQEFSIAPHEHEVQQPVITALPLLAPGVLGASVFGTW